MSKSREKELAGEKSDSEASDGERPFEEKKIPGEMENFDRSSA